MGTLEEMIDDMIESKKGLAQAWSGAARIGYSLNRLEKIGESE
jgi:uncharacterized protein YukE